MLKERYNSIQKKRAFQSLFIVFGFLFSFAYSLPISASSIDPREVVALANGAREKEGLKPLVFNANLAEAAKDKANDMIKNDYFAHTSPQGVDPWFWIKKSGYEYKYAGENLAINYTNAKEQHGAWMKSPTHRSNILSAHYQEIGVATVEGKINGGVSLVTVEIFGTQMVAITDASRSVVPPVAQPAEVKVPEVKGTEAIGTPLVIPLTKQGQAVISNDAKQSLLRMQTSTLTLGKFLKEKLSKVQRNDAIQITAITFLMLAVLLGPLAFLSQAIAVILQNVQEKDMHHGEVSDPMIPSLVSSCNIHQQMKSGTVLMHDIRPG